MENIGNVNRITSELQWNSCEVCVMVLIRNSSQNIEILHHLSLIKYTDWLKSHMFTVSTTHANNRPGYKWNMVGLHYDTAWDAWNLLQGRQWFSAPPVNLIHLLLKCLQHNTDIPCTVTYWVRVQLPNVYVSHWNLFSVRFLLNSGDFQQEFCLLPSKVICPLFHVSPSYYYPSPLLPSPPFSSPLLSL